MSSLRLRVRSKQGVSNLTVEGATPLIKFAQSLEESTKIPVNQQKFLSGYPPTSLIISADNQTVPISELFKTGDVITVEEGPSSVLSETSLPQTTDKLPPPASSLPPPYSAPAPASKGTIQFVTEGEVVRRKIADDNSCLFNAVGYAIEGEISKKSSVLRSLVAHIVTQSDDYNEAVLGKTKQDYASWIMQPNSWGGGIELSILSKEYKTEICAYDILTKIPYCYGEGNNYSQRVYLVYDGIHYDTLTINLMAGEGAPQELDISVFNPNDSTVNSKMAKFIASLNKAGQYTDTATFQILCGDCNKVLTGEKEMAMHAATTGHTGFQEIKK